MTTTPQTNDEASDGFTGDAVCVTAEFARRLELRAAAWASSARRWRRSLKRDDEIRAEELLQLREERDDLTRVCDQQVGRVLNAEEECRRLCGEIERWRSATVKLRDAAEASARVCNEDALAATTLHERTLSKRDEEIASLRADLARVTAELEESCRYWKERYEANEAKRVGDKCAALDQMRARVAELERENEHLRMEDGLSKFYQIQERLAKAEQRNADLVAEIAGLEKGYSESLRARALELEQAHPGNAELVADLRTLAQNIPHPEEVEARDALAESHSPVTPALRHEDKVRESYDRLCKGLNTHGWTVGDHSNHFAFFAHGWYRRESANDMGIPVSAPMSTPHPDTVVVDWLLDHAVVSYGEGEVLLNNRAAIAAAMGGVK